jgi:hypothetical protein
VGEGVTPPSANRRATVLHGTTDETRNVQDAQNGDTLHPHADGELDQNDPHHDDEHMLYRMRRSGDVRENDMNQT